MKLPEMPAKSGTLAEDVVWGVAVWYVSHPCASIQGSRYPVMTAIVQGCFTEEP